MSKQEVILCKELENDLTHAIGKCPHDKLFILTDEHTHRLCLPQLQSIPALENAAEIIIGAEDVHKKSGDSGFRVAGSERTGSQPAIRS